MTDSKTDMSSFRKIIGLWPSADAMALDIGASVTAARKWLHRDRIPEEWWHALLASEVAREAGLTADALVALAARAPEEARS